MYIYNGLTVCADLDGEPEVEVPPKRSKPIPVALDESRFSELPSITQSDNNLTKAIQSMLREYCLAHIRE